VELSHLVNKRTSAKKLSDYKTLNRNNSNKEYCIKGRKDSTGLGSVTRAIKDHCNSQTLSHGTKSNSKTKKNCDKSLLVNESYTKKKLK